MKINNLLSNCIYIAIVILFNFCNSQGVSQNSENENFEVFREKFYSDSTFQRSRITFPLPGLNTEEMGMDDTLYYWKENNLKMIKELNIKDLKKKKIISNSSMIIEKYFLENSGFMVEYYFKLVDRKWFLVRLEYVNT